MLWKVVNKYGRSYMAEGDTADEAIESTRALFESNVVWTPWRVPMPDPMYVFEGMGAIPIQAGEQQTPGDLCAHCGQLIIRLKFPNVTGDPYMWVHYHGTRPRCRRSSDSPYATPREQQC